MALNTNISYNRKRAYKSRFTNRLKKLKSKKRSKGWSRSVLKKGSFKNKIKKILGIFAGLAFIAVFIATIFTLSVVAKYSSELPNPDEPFERGQELTSYVYDRNGKELYKIHGDENRDIASIDEVPLTVQWAFLAAEDIDFYQHKGVDFGGLTKAMLYECCKIGSPRGGSTITQQMIKNTVLTSERTYERKIKEIILSLRIEQKYEKKEVLQLYLNEIGFGGNTYGVKTAARVYFGKDVKDLTLAEGALLAGLPQAPGLYSPLFASDVKRARVLAEERQDYVLDQLKAKMVDINNYARKYNGWDKEEGLITEDKIEKARKQKIRYKSSEININAPHFVFYVEDELQSGNYNDGKPFTLSEVERGGLRITTSLDLDMQQVAEESVKQGVENLAKGYGGNNGALVTIDPKTGQILAMVGSADYFGTPYPEKCVLGEDCKFEPNVNVAVALRQPGSSLKPMVYYTGFESGQLYPASFLPDIPITFTNNYEPKNNDASFMGPMTARTALQLSRNIPAVQAIQITGVTNFLNTVEKFGYTTFTQPEMYGPAIALGAGDVKLVEHTNGFAVLATGGIYHKLSPIIKIEDKEGNVLYDYSKDKSRDGVRVADEKAAYLVDDIIRNYHVTPPPGYEFGGKTGTSDDNRNVYYMGFSPEFVTGVWVGNNDNSKMSTNAYGYTVARPIWIDYTNKVISRFAPTHFTRPGGIVSATVCKDSGLLAEDSTACEKISDLFIKDKLPKKDTYHEVYRVCKDQQNRLARDIDEDLGYAKNKTYTYIVAPKKEWQEYYDKSLGQGEPPTEYCTKNRNPSGKNKPWVVISKPTSGTNVAKGGTLQVKATAYSSTDEIEKIEIFLDSISGSPLTQASNNPFNGNVTIPSTASNGIHNLIVAAYDSSGRVGSALVGISVGNIVSISNPSSGSTFGVGVEISIEASHIGSATVSSAQVSISGPQSTVIEMNSLGGGNYSTINPWVPGVIGTYSLKVGMQLENGETINSSPITVTIQLGA
jgi:membrane peptidoglycan carboxypeptidase